MSVCFGSDKYSFPLMCCFSTFFSPSIILCKTSTILFLSMSVFLLVNFFTRSLDVIGLRIKYRLTSSSDIEVVETSVFCFFSGGKPVAAEFVSGVADLLLVFFTTPLPLPPLLVVSGLPLSLFLECLLLLDECLPFFPTVDGESLLDATRSHIQREEERSVSMNCLLVTKI